MTCAGLMVACTLLPAAAARAPESKGQDVISPEVETRGEAYGRLMRAVLAARRGEFKEATAEVRQAVALEPESADLLIEGAGLLLWMGRRQEAEELGQRALTLAPTRPGAIRFVADLAADRALGHRPDAKARREAIELYGELLAMGEEDADLLRSLISLQLQSGDRQAALDAAERLVALRPGDSQATELVVRLRLDRGDGTEALNHALQYLLRHPQEGTLLQMAEELARDLGAWSQVDQVLSGPDGLGNRVVDAQRLRAEALAQLGRTDEAARLWERLLSADPSDRRVRFSLIGVYRRSSRLADAAELAAGLAGEFPDDARARLLLAESLTAQGDLPGALNAFGAALRLLVAEGAPEAAAIREMVRGQMILLQLRTGRILEAERMAGELEQPQGIESMELRAHIAVANEDWSAAREEARGLRAEGETALADFLEAELLIRSGRPGKAAGKVEEAIEAMGPEARLRLAETYLEVDQAERGEQLLRGWVTAEPENSDAHFHLGAFLYRSGGFPEAEAELREALRLVPDHGPALNFLGYSLAERGERLEEALVLIQRAVAGDPWNGAYLDSLGWVYVKLERLEEARGPLERAAREHPTDPVVLEHLGDLYSLLGERELALTAWGRAANGGPEDEDALRAKIRRLENSPGEARAQAAEEAGAAGRPVESLPPSPRQ